MLLFLDFDGVLHQDSVYRPPGRGIELHAEGALMMHAPILEQILDDCDPAGGVRIVLSTSWIRVIGFGRTVKYLPPGLQERVRGGTWHKEMRRQSGGVDPFDYATRYEQIAQYVNRHAVINWLALDDLHSGDHGWPDDQLDHLVLTDGTLGLGSPLAQADLRGKLNVMFKLGAGYENSNRV